MLTEEQDKLQRRKRNTEEQISKDKGHCVRGMHLTRESGLNFKCIRRGRSGGKGGDAFLYISRRDLNSVSVLILVYH